MLEVQEQVSRKRHERTQDGINLYRVYALINTPNQEEEGSSQSGIFFLFAFFIGFWALFFWMRAKGIIGISCLGCFIAPFVILIIPLLFYAIGAVIILILVSAIVIWLMQMAGL